MAKQSDDKGSGLGDVLEALPTDRLKEQARELMSALGERAVATASDKVGEVTDRLVGYVENGGIGGGGGPGKSMLKAAVGAGASNLKDAVVGKLGGGGGGDGDGGGGKGKGGSGKLKVTNIVEQIDVGVPVRVAYNQWTQFQDFPKFTKRLEQVEQKDEGKLSWKAGIFLSHRTWESTIVEQVPDETIVWKSKGEKGSADGTVTFHELAPNLTRILLVLEYHPQGLFERTGNLWRAQGRRVRLELKHFRRHVMTKTILDQDGVEGWRGEIRDGKVVRSHDEAVEEEGQESEEPQDYDEDDEYDDEQGQEDEETPQDDEEDYEDEETPPEDEAEYEDEDEEEEPESGDDEEDYEEEDAYDDEEEPPPDEDSGDENDEEYDDEEYEDEPEDDYEDEDEPEDESDEGTGRRGSRRALARR
ncbi:SRPBCC family protein [Kitasatospora terrestris]|uniref:Coenzyme Q-binding protein COQ10 START domain-containing protein n=1 Tax=Kitasatospora terrestris TaxID=258051 RepID=A0ABP9EQF3_9ACTN